MHIPRRHEFLGEVPGVQRTSVSIAANTLQGLARPVTGADTSGVIDLESLRDSSCDCYQTLKSPPDWLLGSSTEN
jgi:hypothetical protein